MADSSLPILVSSVLQFSANRNIFLAVFPAIASSYSHSTYNKQNSFIKNSCKFVIIVFISF